MNYLNRIRFLFYLLPILSLLIISCKVSGSDDDPSTNPVGVAIVDIDAALFGNACEIGSVIVNTESVPDGTEIQFDEDSVFLCLVGPDVTVQDGIATAGVVTDYFIGAGLVFEIPLTIQLLLDDGTTFDQFSTVEIIGIGFIPPVSENEDGSFDVEAPAEDDMDPAEPIPFFFDEVGLAEKLDGLMIETSNPALGTATVEVLPDGTILVEYTPVNGTEGANVITLTLELVTDPDIQNACPPGTVSDGATVSESIIINQTAAESEMADAMETDCMNLMDDDEDGMTDCADSDCAMDAACESPEMTCDDGFNNDGDMEGEDCLDSDCDLDPACENGDAECSDGIDNDVPMDGDIDCADAGCEGAMGPMGQTCQPGGEDMCSDMADNDGDGLVDCADPDDCNPPGGPTIVPCEDGTETMCGDGIDNDGDGLVDCADPDDCNPPGGPALGACEDGTETMCGDGIDNDGDGLVDCADMVDCPDTGSDDADACGAEDNATQCGDGFDNDGDGAIDCADMDAGDCNPPGGPTLGACEDGTETMCADGVDNDGDGDTDGDDSDC